MVKDKNMKRKILLLVFLLLIFGQSIKAAATVSSFSGAEFLPNVSYSKYNMQYHQYRNAKAIRNTVTSNIAYCIDSFSTLIDGSTYTGYKEYNNLFNLNKEQWKKIKQLAYFGYGYNDHTDYKWISITQMLIWRTAEPLYSFYWVNNVNERKKIFPYKQEMKELEELVKDANTLPDIKDNIELSKNSTMILADNNKVLSKYKIKKANIDSHIEGNNLVIKAENSGNYAITLIREFNQAEKDTEYFYNEESQTLIERGKLDPIEMSLNITVKSGSIKINKVDSETQTNTPQGEASLTGTLFSVYKDDILVGTIEIDETGSGILEDLEYGKYKIVETKAGPGYKRDINEYYYVIDSEHLNIEITKENDVKSTKIKIIKYYGSKQEYEKNEMKPEKGAIFEFINKDNEIIRKETDEEGTIELTLPYGTYIVRQVSSKENYEKVDDFTIVVDENAKDIYGLVLYDMEIGVPNAYIKETNLEVVINIIKTTLKKV